MNWLNFQQFTRRIQVPRLGAHIQGTPITYLRKFAENPMQFKENLVGEGEGGLEIRERP